MRISVPGFERVVHLRFHHERNDKEVVSQFIDGKLWNLDDRYKNQTFTECHVIFNAGLHGEDPEVGFVGKSYLNPVDQFCAETGRRQSLDRALAVARSQRYISYAHERAIWAEYFSR